jgi:hypothetical protein
MPVLESILELFVKKTAYKITATFTCKTIFYVTSGSLKIIFNVWIAQETA